MNDASQAYWSPKWDTDRGWWIRETPLEKHGQGINLKNENLFEENVMKHLTIVASVEPAKPWTQNRLDELEDRLQKNLRTMDYGGINIRDEVQRKGSKVGY